MLQEFVHGVVFRGANSQLFELYNNWKLGTRMRDVVPVYKVRTSTTDLLPVQEQLFPFLGRTILLTAKHGDVIRNVSEFLYFLLEFFASRRSNGKVKGREFSDAL